MSIFLNRDICSLIYQRLTFEDVCMFRRCSRRMYSYLPKKIFYERKTDHLLKTFRPSQIMGFTTDIDYRRYLKKKGWRAINRSCWSHKLSFIDAKLIRYVMAEPKFKCYGFYSYLSRTCDRRLIDLCIYKHDDEYHGDHCREVLMGIISLCNNELCDWFETKYMNSDPVLWQKREKIAVERLLIGLYHSIPDIRAYDTPGMKEFLYQRYGDKYINSFMPYPDEINIQRFIRDLQQGLMPKRIHLSSISLPDLLEPYFLDHGYVKEGNYLVLND